MHFSRKVGDHNACLPVLIQSESVSCFVVSDSVTPWTVVQQAPVSMGFSKQKYPSGLPFPSPGDLPNPGIEPGAPALQEDSLLSEPPGWDTNGITAVRALETSWAAGSRGYSYSHGTYTHAQRWQRRSWCQGMSRQGPACLPSQRTVWGKPLHPDCGVILSLITGSVDHHLLLVFSLQLLVPFPGCSRWESNSFLSLLCVTPLWPVTLTWVPVAFRRSLKLAGLSSAWQEAGQTELMGVGQWRDTVTTVIFLLYRSGLMPATHLLVKSRLVGEGKGYPLQYSGLENSMDEVHGIAKSQTRLSDIHFHWNSSNNPWSFMF